MGGVIGIFWRAKRPKRLLFHHLGEADDGVQRRAQFMAHIGQEFRLGAAGGFGFRFLLQISSGQFRELLGLRFQRLSRPS